MNSNRSELLAAWIVVVALIGAMGVHTLLPKTPPHLGPGITTLQQRPMLAGHSLETDLPLVERGAPALAESPQ